MSNDEYTNARSGGMTADEYVNLQVKRLAHDSAEELRSLGWPDVEVKLDGVEHYKPHTRRWAVTIKVSRERQWSQSRILGRYDLELGETPMAIAAETEARVRPADAERRGEAMMNDPDR